MTVNEDDKHLVSNMSVRKLSYINSDYYIYLWSLNTISLWSPWTRRPWPSKITLKINIKTIKPTFYGINPHSTNHRPVHILAVC